MNKEYVVSSYCVANEQEKSVLNDVYKNTQKHLSIPSNERKEIPDKLISNEDRDDEMNLYLLQKETRLANKCTAIVTSSD